LNEKNDKAVWLKWMERRVHHELEVRTTPTGYIPFYPDLKLLFHEVLGKGYTQEDYRRQFTTRVKENLAKIDRMLTIFHTRVLDTPPIVFTVLKEQQKRLLDAQASYGEYISPDVL
jgi:phosphoenolpyruvate carboxykinase (GTP)